MCKNLGVEEGGGHLLLRETTVQPCINVDTTFLPLLDFRSLWIMSRW